MPGIPNPDGGPTSERQPEGDSRRAEREAFERARSIFVELCDLPERERVAALERSCGEDAGLRKAVESLLAMDRVHDDLLSDDAVSAGIAFGVDAHRYDEAIPERIGGYRILRKLGDGGMGTVYEAEQQDPQRIVAIKTLQRWHASRPMIRRFRQESQLLGRLQHPGIAHIYEASVHNAGDGSPPLPFFAMELVRGVPLHRHLELHRLSVRDRLALFLQVADAIAYAHQRGIVHRDLKPGNILVTDEGQPKVIDFGIATSVDREDLRSRTAEPGQWTTLRTSPGQLVGTVPYMSPEQFGGDPTAIDVRTDVYSLGVVLYEMLAGRLPHDVRSLSLPDAARTIRDDSHPRLGSVSRDCRGDLETIVNKALEKEPGRRYPSVIEFAADVRRYLEHQPISARSPSTFDQLAKFTRRNKPLVGGIVGTFLVLIAGIISTTSFWWEARANFRSQRWATYRATIEAASMALEQDDVRGAREQLALSPPELRGWEWKFLSRGLDQWESVVECDGELIGGLSFHGDGRSVAGVLADGRVCVWDIDRGTLIRSCTLGAPIVAIADAVAGDFLAVATSSNDVVLVNVSTAEAAERFAVDEPPQSLALDPEGRSIVVGTNQRLIVFDRATHAVRWQHAARSLSRGAESVARVAVVRTAHGDRLLASIARSSSRAEQVVCDLATGEETGRFRTDDGRVPAALAPNGETLAIGAAARDLLLVDLPSSEIRARPTGDRKSTRRIRFAPDGSLVASLSRDGLVRVRDVGDGRSIAALQQPVPPAGVDGLAFDREGRRLATTDGSRIYVWRIGSELAPQLRGHRGFAYSASFASDSRTIASGSFNDLTTRLWDALTGESIAAFPGVKEARDITFTDDDTIVVDGAARLTIDAATGEIRSRERDEPWRRPRRESAIRADGSTLDATFGFRRDGAFGQSTQVRVTARVGNAEREVALLDHASPVRAVAFAPQARLLAVGCDDGLVDLWDPSGPTHIRSLEGHVGTVYSVAFSPDGTRLATCGNDGALRLWDCDSWERVLDRRDHRSYVHSVRFSPDGSRIVTASGDGTLRLWDSVGKPQRLAERRVAEGTRDAAVRLVESAVSAHPIADVAHHLRSDEALDGATRTAALREIARRSSAQRGDVP
ncbi:MAG: protein kinase [Phycisphaerae bacterium]|nr:protein kinase [Phycisphaerae bacterium]